MLTVSGHASALDLGASLQAPQAARVLRSYVLLAAALICVICCSAACRGPALDAGADPGDALVEWAGHMRECEGERYSLGVA